MPLECPGCKKAYGRQDLLTKHLVKCKARQKRSKDIDDLAATLKQTGHSQADKRRRLETLDLEGSSRRTKARTETYETNTNASASIVSKDRSSSVVERPLPPVAGSHVHRGNTLEESRLEFEGMDIEPNIHEQDLRSMAEQLDSTVQVANSIENLQLEALPDTVMKRTRRPTRKILDMLPEGPAPLPPLSPVPQPEPEEFRRSYVQLSNRVRLRLVNTVRTMSNSFGLSRIYYGKLTTIPDENLGIEELSGKFVSEQSEQGADGPFSLSQTIKGAIYPYPNLSSWRVGNWFWTQGETKLKAGLKSLVDNVILAEDFDREELRDVSWDAIDEKLAKGKGVTKASLVEGWQESSVEILMPTGIKTLKEVMKKMKAASNASKGSTSLPRNPPAGQKFTVEGVFHRPLVPLVCYLLENNPAVQCFHFQPF
ncbi:hypothetical protein M422DRAFT_276427 [Sphaerobolus stellatus SS14]|uniref:Uncharacterized protein n=1 Tax=Sphaerobolus stellatus (strain SS14) TaxID=990650 RepID=A0A0C9U1Z6_SPHS4|nr:hypothetical protein M422DRAFT_276427 [Sphaerobolus stellatus SS14]